jgi:hypothetical protein
LLVPPAAQSRQGRPLTTFLSHGQTKARMNHRESAPVALPSLSGYFPPAVAKDHYEYDHDAPTHKGTECNLGLHICLVYRSNILV